MNSEIQHKISKLFGKEIRLYRQVEIDKTQEEFAETTGIGPNHIGSIERGEKLVRIDTILRLRNSGVNLNKILDEILADLDKEGWDLTDE